jgi:PAP2 superfamily
MAGRSGNLGNRPGGVGAVGGAADFIPVLSDRVDLPFVTETVYDPKRHATHISDQIIDIKEFPDRRWSAEWRAWYALSEYVQTDWSKISVDPWYKSDKETEKEIGHLVRAARDERADALGEIVAQHEEFASYFFALLTVDPAMYPATNLLISVASIVGTFTVLHFKYGIEHKYRPRPRPSQVCPALLPPVPVPGHPSYPSGHATEAHLIEFVLNEVFKGSKKEAAMASDLSALATRIARNREIAGLHYPSDSRAGKNLAKDIHTLLQKHLKVCTVYANAIIAAQSEWKD